MIFCETSGSICVGPRHSPAALCLGPRRSLCRVPALSRSLCRARIFCVGPGPLCRAPALSAWVPALSIGPAARRSLTLCAARSLCRALCPAPGALPVSRSRSSVSDRRSTLCAGAQRVPARRSCPGALCVGPRHSLAVCAGPLRSACLSACHPSGPRPRLRSACYPSGPRTPQDPHATHPLPRPRATHPRSTAPPSSGPRARPPLIRPCHPSPPAHPFFQERTPNLTVWGKSRCLIAIGVRLGVVCGAKPQHASMWCAYLAG